MRPHISVAFSYPLRGTSLQQPLETNAVSLRCSFFPNTGRFQNSILGPLPFSTFGITSTHLTSLVPICRLLPMLHLHLSSLPSTPMPLQWRRWPPDLLSPSSHNPLCFPNTAIQFHRPKVLLPSLPSLAAHIQSASKS